MNHHFREYVKATGVTSAFYFAIYLFHPILSVYIKGLGFNDLELGILFGLFPLVMVFAAPIMGRISDHLGRKQVILFGVGCQIVAIVLYMFDTYKPVLYAARLMEAISFVSVIYIGLALVEDNVKDRVRGKFSGWSLTLIQAGQIVAPLIGGWTADIFYIKFPFIVAMAFLLILFIVLIFKNHKSESNITKDDFNILQELKEYLKDRRLRGMALLGFFMHATIALTFVYLPIFIVEDMQLPFKYVGIASFAYSFFHLFQFWFGSVADRVGKWRSVLMGASITGIGLGLLGFTQNYWVFIGVLTFAGVGGAIWNVSAMAYLSKIGEKLKLEGTVLGSYVSFAKIGSASSFVISGLITYRYGVQTLMWCAGGAVILASFAAYWFLKPEKGKKFRLVKRRNLIQ